MKIETKIRKTEQHWATMRQNMALLYRAKCPDSTIDAVRAELIDNLDSLILSYPPTLEALGLNENQSYVERKETLGVRSFKTIMFDEEKKFVKSLVEKAHISRRLEWQWRVSQEHEEKQQLGWYPFFITLTVDPKIADPEQIWREGKELRLFIRSLCKEVTDVLGHPEARKKTKRFDYRPESDYITYMGVVEHGKSREHHHGHFMVWMRDIPDSWKQCPNRGLVNPRNRTRNNCKPITTHWKWSADGLSKANYFRSIGDIWSSKHKFMTPLDSKTGQAMRMLPGNIAGVYITKYMTKGYKEWKHRVKATRNLGLKKLNKTLKQLPNQMIEALTWRPENSELNHIVMRTHTVPLGLLRSVTKRKWFAIRYMQKQLDFRSLMVSNSGIYNRMLTSVRAGQRPDRMRSTEFYDWVGKHLGAQKGYCEKLLIEAHDNLAALFCPIEAKYQHVKIGANKIGNS